VVRPAQAKFGDGDAPAPALYPKREELAFDTFNGSAIFPTLAIKYSAHVNIRLTEAAKGPGELKP